MQYVELKTDRAQSVTGSVIQAYKVVSSRGITSSVGVWSESIHERPDNVKRPVDISKVSFSTETESLPIWRHDSLQSRSSGRERVSFETSNASTLVVPNLIKGKKGHDQPEEPTPSQLTTPDQGMTRFGLAQALAGHKRMSSMINSDSMSRAQLVVEKLKLLVSPKHSNRASIMTTETVSEKKEDHYLRRHTIMRGREGQPRMKKRSIADVLDGTNYHAAQDQAEELLEKVQGVLTRTSALWKDLDRSSTSNLDVTELTQARSEYGDTVGPSDRADSDESFAAALGRDKAREKRHYVNTDLEKQLAEMKQKVLDRTRGTTCSELMKFLNDYGKLQEFESQLDLDRETVLKSLHRDFKRICAAFPSRKIDWEKMECEIGNPDLKDHCDKTRESLERTKKIFSEDMAGQEANLESLVGVLKRGHYEREHKMEALQREMRRKHKQNYTEKIQESLGQIAKDFLSDCTLEERRNNIARALKVKQETMAYLEEKADERKKLEQELAEKQHIYNEIQRKIHHSDSYGKLKTRRAMKKKMTTDLLDFCINTKLLVDKMDNIVKTTMVEAHEDHIHMKKHSKDVKSVEPINNLVKDLEEKRRLLTATNDNRYKSTRKEDKKMAASLLNGAQEVTSSVQQGIKKHLHRIETESDPTPPATRLRAYEGATIPDLKRLDDKGLEAYLESATAHLAQCAQDGCTLADYTLRLCNTKALAGTTSLLGYTDVSKLRFELLKC